MSAQVTLTGSASWSGRGYQFKKGKPQLVSNQGDVEFFDARKGEFFVQLESKVKAVSAKAVQSSVDESAPSSAPAPAPAAKKTAKRRAAVRKTRKSAAKKGG